MILESTGSVPASETQGPPQQEHDVHLSVVATSRNDDHGGNLLQRMQHFVDGFVAQCRHHDLSAELILVEWNPPADRPSLADALRWPEERGPLEIRIITIPPGLHARLKHADKVPLFQMIAKNVGIRRARGRFVLATNIDILFSDAIIRFMRNKLKPGRVYRVDRCDVPPDLPTGVPFDEVLTLCDRNIFRIYRRNGTFIRRNGGWKRVPSRVSPLLARWKVRLGTWWRESLIAFIRRVAAVARRVPRVMLAHARLRVKLLLSSLFGLRPHTNACGDFTLMSSDDWYALRGYPEWQIFPLHVDSVLLHQARYNGFREVDLNARTRIYHIEHGIGSGFTPEGQEALFDRLEKNGIPYLTYEDFLRILAKMRRRKKAGGRVSYNPEDWGIAGYALPETTIE